MVDGRPYIRSFIDPYRISQKRGYVVEAVEYDEILHRLDDVPDRLLALSVFTLYVNRATSIP